MAIQGKKRIVIYVDEENYKFMKTFVDSRPNLGGISGLLDRHLKRDVMLIKANKDYFDIKNHGKMSLAKLIHLATRLKSSGEPPALGDLG